jgi:hypothetical protein
MLTKKLQLQYYEKLLIVQNQFITLLQIFVHICLNLKLFGLSVSGFDLFDK